MSKRTFYAAHEINPGNFIAIIEGETGYRKTTIYTQEHADEMNRRSGVSQAEVAAAEACSMFDCWQNFDKLVKVFN